MMATSTLTAWEEAKATLRADEAFDRILGPPDGRKGERSSKRRWWCCPLHADGNPSFCQAAGEWTAHCFGCSWHGDVLDLAQALNPGWTFGDAVRFLTGDQPAPASARPVPRPAKKGPAADDGPPSMLDTMEALSLVCQAEEALWTDAGAEALAYLYSRGLSDDTIRRARLGWTPALPLKGRPEGIVIPWVADDQIEAVNLRQPEGRRPKYRKVYHASPSIYPDPDAIEPGRPLVIVEGELDALLVQQELGEVAAVATLGGASVKPSAEVLSVLLMASPWVIAVDNDEAGDERARKWAFLGRRSRRVVPPEKDWTDCHAGGWSRIRYHLGRELAMGQTREELEALRWGQDVPDGVETEAVA